MGYDLVRASDASPDRLRGDKPKKSRRKARARVALRLRLDLVNALDDYVSRLQEEDDRVNRTSTIEKAIRIFLKKKGAL